MTSIATTSHPAASAAAASRGPERSSASRRDTDVEMVRTAVRMRESLTRARETLLALGVRDQRAHAGLVAPPEQLDRIRRPVDDSLEERLPVLVGRERGLRPA